MLSPYKCLYKKRHGFALLSNINIKFTQGDNLPKFGVVFLCVYIYKRYLSFGKLYISIIKVVSMLV